MEFSKTLTQLLNAEDLDFNQSTDLMNEIMEGKLSLTQISALLVALRMKGESPVEIAGFAKTMRAKTHSIDVAKDLLVDTCGTGGDGKNTINVSTAAAFVVAACGGKVAKHGNRSVSSKCGSADVLDALGVNINVDQKIVQDCIENVGIGFLFAPNWHPAMKFVVPVRKELGIRTVFNILGPLTNPAGAKYQIIGCFDKEFASKMSQALKEPELGIERAFVVHGFDGMDEVTTTDKTYIYEVKNNLVDEYEFDPTDYGIQLATQKDLEGGSAEDNAQLIKDILSGEKSPKRDIVVVNAAFAILACGLVENIDEAIKLCQEKIDDSSAMKKCEELIEFTNREHSIH